MNIKPTTPEAYHLMLDGALEFADAEEAGIAIDVDHLKRIGGVPDKYGVLQGGSLQKEIDTLKRNIGKMPEGVSGLERYGRKWDPSNNNHVANVLQDVGHVLPQTENENTTHVKTDAETLAAVGGPFVVAVMRMRKLEKVRNTYVAQWLREVDPDGYMHPVFNLHTVKTYRSSSDNPNFQNVPRRDKEVKQLLRQAIIPSEGNQIVEVDYGAMEVRILACYSRDPVLMKYIEEDNDLHADAASWFFGIPRDEVTKPIRDVAKNGIVFPLFYGSWWKPCARNVWKRVREENMLMTSGIPLKEHIASLHQLDALMETGEKIFWKRFKETRVQQELWIEEYNKTGGFEMLTGHCCSGVMSRNDLFNWRVQGTAFLCLLWAFIQVSRRMKEQRAESRLIGQIHDSMVNDAVPSELPSWARETRYTMTDGIRKHWDWINVPLLAEFEATEVDGNWGSKTEMEVT